MRPRAAFVSAPGDVCELKIARNALDGMTISKPVQSFPRVLSLRDGRLAQEPIAELKRLRQAPLKLSKVTIEEANKRLASFHGQAYELEVDGADTVELLKGDGQATVVSVKT